MEQKVVFTSIKLVREREVAYTINAPFDASKAVDALFDLVDATQEHFGVLGLDTKNNVMIAQIISIGTVNQSLVDPVTVFRPLLLGGASRFIVFHNHPSGDAMPSEEDIGTTERLIQCAKLLNLELLDHIIIGAWGDYSFREKSTLFI